MSLDTFGYGLLISILVGVGGTFVYRQWRTLAKLRQTDAFSLDDRRYLRHQAWRRLACSGIMLLLAAMLVGAFFLGFEKRSSQLGEEGERARLEGNENPTMSPEQRRFYAVYTAYWGTALLLVMIMLFVAAADMYAIFRFGLRHHRQIQADRREMVRSEVARYRRERNGTH